MIITTSPLVEQLIKKQDLHESPSWVILIDNVDNWTQPLQVYIVQRSGLSFEFMSKSPLLFAITPAQ